ncbi:MAG: TetR/AcrR family transcriptional regulator [Lachnospiraceae bacterium]|nr:TetR/AcrR family transcriptional regulator [Lachnospiraceae bacterium]
MKKGEQRKQELLKIAYKMFIEKGYDNTSVDEIIAEAGIAKGTYYYYFPSKEDTLEAVIDMMINEEVANAKGVVASRMPIPQKVAAVIYSLRPGQEEQNIAQVVESNENIILHEKLNKRLIEEAVPLLSEVVREGNRTGVFECEQIEERVKMILIICSRLFDEDDFTENEVTAFIDVTEKILGAQPGTMSFVSELILGENKR